VEGNLGETKEVMDIATTKGETLSFFLFLFIFDS